VKKKGSLLGGADAVERKAVSACGLMDLGVILHRRRYLEKCRHRRKRISAMMASWAGSVCEAAEDAGEDRSFLSLCDN